MEEVRRGSPQKLIALILFVAVTVVAVIVIVFAR